MEDVIIFGTMNPFLISPNSSNNIIFSGGDNDVIDLSNTNGNNRVYGGGGNDKLIASFNDYLFGGNGDDQLFTGNGGNTLSGGQGSDQFWLVKNGVIPEHNTVIIDFTLGVDKIVIDGITGVSQLNDLTLNDEDGKTLIKIGDQNLATLLGVNKAQLQESDFIFQVISITANLANNTENLITSDPSIRINIENNNLKNLQVRLNNNTVDILSDVNNDGGLILDEDKLTEINGQSLTDGDYNFQVFAIDNNDNSSELINFDFTVDTTPPSLNITSPNVKLSSFTPDLSINNSPVDPMVVNLVSPNTQWGISNLIGTVGDTNLANISYQLNDLDPVNITVNENGQFNQPLLLNDLENTYPLLTVIAIDKAGNITRNELNLGVILTTETGLGYLDIEVGNGVSPEPSLNDNVTVHYTGVLTNGTVFDSSRSRGVPSTFSINGVIPGFKEGLDSMQVGGRRILFIPSSLGYGPTGTGSIPPNSTLIFDVELLEVTTP